MTAKYNIDKDFIVDTVNKLIIVDDRGKLIELNQIYSDYILDFKKDSPSHLSFNSMLWDKDIFELYVDNRTITKVIMDIKCEYVINPDIIGSTVLTIPCEMKINNLKYYDEYKMYFELVGNVE